MTTIHKATLVAVVLAAAPVFLGQAFAASGTHMGCNMTAMTKDGMRIEFRNTGKSEVPAGATLHWVLRGSAQGDATANNSVPPGGMMTQDYTMSDMANMSADVPCSVQMM